MDFQAAERMVGKMEAREFDLRSRLEEIAVRWNQLTPLMVQMGIIDDLLNRKIVVEEREGESLTLSISGEGMRVDPGKDPWAHAFMCTTREQWQRILAGEKPFCAIFRGELEPVRSPVKLNELAVVERFSTVLQAMVNLPRVAEGGVEG